MSELGNSFGLSAGRFVVNFVCRICKTKPGILGGEAVINIAFDEFAYTKEGGVALSPGAVMQFNVGGHKEPKHDACAVGNETRQLGIKNITFVPGRLISDDVKELKVKGLNFKRLGDYFICGFHPPVEISLQ